MPFILSGAWFFVLLFFKALVITQQDIFSIASTAEFERATWEIFQYQFENNPIYRSYCDLLCKHPSDIHSIESIPFLPIEFFKTTKVISGNPQIQKTFRSSGTTGIIRSQHHVADLQLYQKSGRKGFETFYGPISNYAVLALLPSYSERNDASLVSMVEDWMTLSPHQANGFYLNNLNALTEVIAQLEAAQQPTILIGVTFALLDLAEQFPQPLKHTILMETGGMKGRRKELIRSEVHGILANAFNLDQIHSEYGMTELLSQAYSKGNGSFHCPPWMKALVREQEDPFQIAKLGATGGLNIIDLANLHSCSFLATQDLGRLHSDQSFEVLGRFDDSDVRGCNLMVI
ncbi:MAG: acyl transferase [Flavobacteriaceae bacterium]